MKKIYTLAALLFLSINVNANESGWKYVKPDPGFHSGYSIVKSGSKYLKYNKRGFTFVSNVGCKNITSFVLEEEEVTINCNRNKWGNWVLQFPESTNSILTKYFTIKNKVKFGFIFIDGSSASSELSAIGFNRTKKLVDSK